MKLDDGDLHRPRSRLETGNGAVGLSVQRYGRRVRVYASQLSLKNSFVLFGLTLMCWV